MGSSNREADLKQAAKNIAEREASLVGDEDGDEPGSESDGAEGVAPPKTKKAAVEHPRGGNSPKSKEIGATEREMDKGVRGKMGWDQAKPGNPANLDSCERAHGVNSGATTSPKIAKDQRK